MVNYSKWDNLDVSDDEMEDAKPRVQRFDGPQKVTFGGNGDSGVTVCPQSVGEEAEEEDDDEPMEASDDELATRTDGDCREDVLQCRALAERALQRGDAAEGVRLLEKALRIGGGTCPGLEDLLQAARKRLSEQGQTTAIAPAKMQSSPASDEDALRNGGLVEGRYAWRQTKDSVVVEVFVADGTKAKDVKVQVEDTKVCITAAGIPALAGEWEFKVEPDEDANDWEMCNCHGRRAVRLTVRKAKLHGGLSVVVWWKRVLKGDPEIDTTKIEDRKKGASESFSKAWEEAHIKFRESVQAREKTVIDA